MPANYPGVDQWVIPAGVFRETLAGVRPTGRLGKEAGAFWLGRREATAHINSLVLPRGGGVVEESGRWAVSPGVFGVITRWAKARDFCLLAVAHTHVRGVRPVLSWTDRELGVRVPGMLAVVIGNGGDDSDHREWGWYVFENDDYRPLSAREMDERVKIVPTGSFEAWTADSSGVQALRT